MTQLQHQIAQAERQVASVPSTKAPARYPLAPDQIALSHYHQRIAFDDELRNDIRHSFGFVDEVLVQRLRDAMAGRLTDADLNALIGERLESFRDAGNLTALPGSDEWRQIARALCVAEYEALARVAERDEGDFTGKPDHPLLTNAKLPEPHEKPVSLLKLSDDYVLSWTQAGFMKDRGKRHATVIANLRKFLKHNDARKITKLNLIEWRDQLVKKFAAKTVNDAYLSSVRSMLNWAFENERLPENVAATVKQPKPKKVYGRECGYTDAEAVFVLKASRSYQPHCDEFGRVRETPQSIAAKRWVPIICAFTGARVSEITQLRVEDVRKEGDRLIIRITPDAGTVKAGGYRDVPLHRQIIALGFEEFVKGVGHGPIFHNGTDPKRYAAKAQRMSNQIADWLRVSEIRPDGVQPNHGWRHRLKTQAMELGLNTRVIDAMQGHTGRTAGENYGDVTLNAKASVIEQLPEYDIT
ncbi:tyrosine-type recombinase/integrase [Gemmobacter serpentinus]|uniref:tyrosine-type recombinase/integrase n=1 Tax=Gemmobacter serpentinus TaxID=2652247 RepID=UPI001CF6E924|nr:tyrosine-type recombinase/integrase [Gemmobacter serpentinus]